MRRKETHNDHKGLGQNPTLAQRLSPTPIPTPCSHQKYRCQDICYCSNLRGEGFTVTTSYTWVPLFKPPPASISLHNTQFMKTRLSPIAVLLFPSKLTASPSMAVTVVTSLKETETMGVASEEANG